MTAEQIRNEIRDIESDMSDMRRRYELLEQLLDHRKSELADVLEAVKRPDDPSFFDD